MNTLSVINAYKDKRTWVFDEPEYGLVKEPFVAGADNFLDYVTRKKRDKVTLVFSSKSFPISNYSLKLWEECHGGGIYHENSTKSEMWLCGATKHYFNGKMPKEIHVQCIVEPRLTDEELSDIYAFDHTNIKPLKGDTDE
tara:strand:+ start:4803 stop:5222 length:420 start_codon:yes stop_codon:yes gene_type:complete